MPPPLLHAASKTARTTLAPSTAFARRPFNEAMLIKAAIAIPQSSHNMGIPLQPVSGGEFLGSRSGTCVRRPVKMVSVEVDPPEPVGVSALGENEQLAATGKPLQLRVTGCENPENEVRVTSIAVEFPAATVADEGVAVIPKSDCCPTPVPVSKTICGLPGALSVSVRAPTLDPAPEGAKVTLMTQLVVGCSDTFMQSSVSEKSPLAVILVKATGLVPLLVAVIRNGLEDISPTCCCPNDRLEADSVSVDACPFSGTTTFCVSPVPVAVIGMDALRSPGPWGVKDAVIVHWPPGGRDVAQVVVTAKSAGFGEVGATAIDERVTGLSPFVKVMT